MIQYKTVAGPVGLTIGSRDSYTDAVKQYAAIIDREAVGGWKLDCIQEIPVTRSVGCLAALFGKKDETVFFNMLVFSKDDDFVGSNNAIPISSTQDITKEVPIIGKEDNEIDIKKVIEEREANADQIKCDTCGRIQSKSIKRCLSCGNIINVQE